jgi:hypothetical protein
MHQLVDRTTRTGGFRWDVINDVDMLLGQITQSRPGRQGRVFYAAAGPDGYDLGHHPTVELAVAAIATDAGASWPRSPRNPNERYRELYDGPAAPVYPICMK